MNEIEQKFEAYYNVPADKLPELSKAWRAAYEAGEIAMKEKAAKTMEALSANWVNSLPMDEVQSLNCKQYARAIRALPLSGAEESTK